MGADIVLPPDLQTGNNVHTMANVYREMLIHICREYRTLPDPRTLTLREIRFFFEPIRDLLKPKPKK